MSSPGMIAGSASVDSNGIVTGSDFALALYTADAATLTVPAAPALGQTTPPYCQEIPATQADIDVYATALITMKQEAARRATAYAAGIVSYFTANAFAHVVSGHGGDGLQTSQAAGTATSAPATDKYIPIV